MDLGTRPDRVTAGTSRPGQRIRPIRLGGAATLSAGPLLSNLASISDTGTPMRWGASFDAS